MTFSSARAKVIRGVSSIALVAAMLSGIAPAHAAPSTVHLTVHYQRPSEDYTGWNLWLWKNVAGTTGDVPVSPNGVDFNGTDSFGKVLTMDIPNMQGFDNIGFIVRLNNWASKDISDDRFITNFDSNGNAEIWLIQADTQIYTAAPTSTSTFRSANIDGFRQITVDLSARLTLSGSGNEGFTVSDGIKVVSVTALNGSTTSASQLSLLLDSDVTLGKTYTVTHPTFGKISTTPGQIMNSEGFNARYTYTGNDLGNTYSKAQTQFRVWAPTATSVDLVIYPNANASSSEGVITHMKAAEQGTWTALLTGELNGAIYTYRVTVGGVEREAVDPYVRATTINGTRGVVVDLSKTNPTAWSKAKPAFSGKPTDAVIYELHVRDLSMDPSGNIPLGHRGKYLALTDVKTSSSKGVPSGINAIKDLGVTHVELLPVFDFASVDESSPTFNWGYDPQNYNVPEGSYSSNPANPLTRIEELKSAVQALHNDKLRVMMDVVYNHVYNASSFNEANIVPGYFFRTNADGTLSNGSGVGNDVASERPMVRKFIVDSVTYWASQYHIDGFRFDLMGLLDIATMQQIRQALNKIDPTILIIGEGWDMGTLAAEARANQKNIANLNGIAAFNDELRDGIKGSVFDVADLGYTTGKFSQIDNVKVGVVGNIDYGHGLQGKWTTTNPGQSVNYVESHDNLTLFDKLQASVKGASSAKLATLDRLSSAIVLLAQGVPFMQAGQEFLRSKNGDSNSYKSSDSVNSLKWNLRAKNAVTVKYFKGLLELRAAHPGFRMTSAGQVRSNLAFLKEPNNVIAYSIKGNAVKDSWKVIVVAHNPNSAAVTVALPGKGNWKVVVQGAVAGTKVLATLKSMSSVSLAAQSTLVLEK